jgi:hypothetical protein
MTTVTNPGLGSAAFEYSPSFGVTIVLISLTAVLAMGVVFQLRDERPLGAGTRRVARAAKLTAVAALVSVPVALVVALFIHDEPKPAPAAAVEKWLNSEYDVHVTADDTRHLLHGDTVVTITDVQRDDTGTERIIELGRDTDGSYYVIADDGEILERL